MPKRAGYQMSNWYILILLSGIPKKMPKSVQPGGHKPSLLQNVQVSNCSVHLEVALVESCPARSHSRPCTSISSGSRFDEKHCYSEYNQFIYRSYCNSSHLAVCLSVCLSFHLFIYLWPLYHSHFGEQNASPLSSGSRNVPYIFKERHCFPNPVPTERRKVSSTPGPKSSMAVLLGAKTWSYAKEHRSIKFWKVSIKGFKWFLTQSSQSCLVVSTPLKNISQLRLLVPIYGN